MVLGIGSADRNVMFLLLASDAQPTETNVFAHVHLCMKCRSRAEDMDDYYKDSLRVFEGPVLPCEATAESVIENAQGMVVPMTFMNENSEDYNCGHRCCGHGKRYFFTIKF